METGAVTRRGDRATGATASLRLGVALLLAVGLRPARTAAGPGGPEPPGPAPATIARARFLMGTRLSIEIDGPVPERTFEAAFGEVARLEDVLSNWRASSEIARLNAEAARGPFRCSRDLFSAVRSALRFAEETGGAFDPTVEPLTAALRLRGETGRLPGAVGPAAPADDRDVRDAPVGWRHVETRERDHSVRFDAPGVGLDLGGIGKGIALDAAARTLRVHGVREALLDFGGQILAIGGGGDPRGAPVGIADPADRGRAAAVLRIADLSVATSGNSERAVAGADGPIGHILDPSSRRSALFEGTVTVAAADATAADALSTALFVMGPGRGAAWADARGVAALYLWRDRGGALRHVATRAFEGRFAGWELTVSR